MSGLRIIGFVACMALGTLWSRGQSCKFSVYYHGKPYAMNTLKDMEDDTVLILQFKIYVRYLEPQKNVWHHELLDFYLAKEPLILKLPKGADSVQLWVGVDSSLQEKGVGTGVLDPKNDLYWGWFPGYIGVKVEGVSTPKYGSFQYHLGGFRRFNANNASFWVKPKKSYAIDLEEFISKIPKEKEGKIMSPGAGIPTLVQEFVQCIHEVD